jgi:cellulose synthase/poly-beta-1,6-N-acetylglucosamine synthase-like glycosyltransferase
MNELYRAQTTYSKIHDDFEQTLIMVLVIPCYDEEDILQVLDSIRQCHSFDFSKLEIVVVINSSELDSDRVKQVNEEAYTSCCKWLAISDLYGHVLRYDDLPHKKAGVGLARKLGMDLAGDRLKSIGREDGLIVNLDADCRVAENYLSELANWFEQQKLMTGCSIYFEHPFPDDRLLREAIQYYELHLRYYIEAQRWLKLPYAYHTIGSSMAVRASGYEKVGGMNTRKAGEDFYFLHKIIGLCNFEDLNSTVVYPSARISERVPFGTGRAVLEFIEKDRYRSTYGIEIFIMLNPLFDWVKSEVEGDQLQPDQLLELVDPILKQFLLLYKFESKWVEIVENTSSIESKIKRFFQWFDAFLLMKWCHFCRDEYQMTGSTNEIAAKWIQEHHNISIKADDITRLLEAYRQVQKSSVYSAISESRSRGLT